MANKFEVATIFKAVDKMTAPISRIQNKIGIMTRSATRGIKKVQRATSGWLRGLKKVGKAAVVAGAIVASALIPVTAAGISFEQTIVNATAKMGPAAKRGTEAFARIEASAMKLGATTEFSATQAAGGVNFLAMAGFSAEQTIAALPGVIDLATASSTDLGTATDIATDSLGALGLMTKNSAQLSKNLARVTDVLAKTTTSANVSMGDMFESIRDGAPVGVAAGQSFETIATFIAKMGDAGIKGSKGGTALKRVFLALGAPGGEASKVMHRLGVQTVDASGNVRDAIAVFKDFSKATRDLPSAQKLAVFDKIFGKIPIAAALNLTAAAGSMDAFRDTLLGSAGAAGEMASTMRDTTRGSINSLKSAVEGVSISLFKLNRGPFKEAIDNATKWVRANGTHIAQKLGEFFLGIAKNIGKIVTALKTVATVVAVLWTLNSVLGVLTATMTLVNVVMAANPIVLVTLAVVAMVASVVLAIQYWDELKAMFNELPAFMQALAKVMPNPLNALIRGADLIISKWEPIKTFFTDLANIIASVTGAAAPDFSGISNADRSKPNAYATGGLPSVSSPLDRQASILEERRVTNSTEVVIRDETGRAEAAPNAAGLGLTVQSTGDL